MIVWTPTVFECLICMLFLFLYCTCSAQLSMFHMEKRSRNTLIIIIIGGTLKEILHSCVCAPQYKAQCHTMFPHLKLCVSLCMLHTHPHPLLHH